MPATSFLGLLDQSTLLDQCDGEQLIKLSRVCCETRRQVKDYIQWKLKKWHLKKTDHLNFYPRPKWKLSRVLSQLRLNLEPEATWRAFVKLYGYYSRLETRLEEEARTGVTVYSGFQRDFTTLLKWHTEQPNFWYRRPNEPIDEESYLTTGEQLRIKVVRKQVASMKSLYQRIIEDLYVERLELLILASNPNWLVIFSTDFKLLEGRTTELHVFNFFTTDAAKFHTVITFDRDLDQYDMGTCVQETLPEDRQINCDLFYFAAFNNDTRERDLIIVDLAKGKIKFEAFMYLDYKLRDPLSEVERPDDVDELALEMKNDNIRMNSKVFNYSARLRRHKRARGDYLVELSDEQIYALYAAKLRENALKNAVVMGVRWETRDYEEYCLLVANFRTVFILNKIFCK